MKRALKILISILSFFAVGVLVTRTGTQPASANIPETAVSFQQDFITGQATSYELSPAVRDLEPERDGGTLDREINPRHNPLAFEPDMGQRGTWDRDNVPTDPLIANSQNASSLTPGLDFSFEGTGNPTGCGSCSPPDTVGDVGPNHYVHMVNATKVAIFDKAGNALNTPFNLGTLWSSGNCTGNAGDPIPLYDSLADRWLLSQFASPSHMCVAISQTADPLGSYHLYTFDVGSFPDYFKFGVWPDAYYMSANEATYTAYAFDRAKMLVGDGTATFQKFTGEDNLLLPADLDGPTSPPAGEPGYFYTFKDNSFHGGVDRLELFALDVDWVTPANTTFTLIETIPVTAFTYTACGFFNFNCLMQPGTAQRIDAISEWPMFRFPYRNFGSHQTLIGNFTIGGGTGEVGAAIRWFELRDTGGGWTLYQEGTQDPGDGHDRAVGSMAMDKNGNIALGYTVSSSSLFPSIHYATRLATDPLGTLQTEAVLITGTGSQTGSNRWGDYSAMGIDPANDCSFWYTNEYYPITASTTWKTRVGVFTIPECLSADFTITATPPSQQICTPNDALYTVDIGSTSGSPIVNLSASGHPAGTTASFSVNNQSAPYTSTLTISDTVAATPGLYAIDIVGMGPTSTHTTTVQLDLFANAPTAPALVTPANGASGVSSSPTFEWTAVANATSYHLEVATDAAFSTIVYTATVSAPTTSHTAATTLSANTLYYWRVTANNPCGAGPASSTFSFLTANLICSTPGLPINGGPHTDDMIITANGIITDINISLDISHSWVGDLIVAVEHVDTGTTLTLVDQPGLPNINPSDGCNDNDLVDFILDDESANGPHDDACSNTDTTPAYPAGSDWDPIQTGLTVFDGETLSGTWRISITDAFPTLDNGVLNEWCIIPELPGAPEIVVEPASLISTQQPDTTVTHTLTISNAGTGLLDWIIVEQNESTFLETVTVATNPETAENATNLTPSMQALLQDKEPMQNLQPQGATPCVGNMAGSYPCNNIDLLSFLPLSTFSASSGNTGWGWTDPLDGKEYAIMGLNNGTAFVDISDPVNPLYLGKLPTHTGSSIWREFKVADNYVYIVSDSNGSHGMQVFDLTELRNVVSPPITFSETTHYNGVGSAHNIATNEATGFAYIVGAAACSGGLHMVNIQNPTSPTLAGCFSADGYTHDTQCVVYTGPDIAHQGAEICLNSNEDTLTIVDVTDKGAPVQLARVGYPGSSYTHQGWLTEDQVYFLLDDELDETGNGHNTRTYIWDVSDLDNPFVMDTYTATTAAIDHNQYIRGDYDFQANYRSGLRILDITDVANGNLVEEGYFDIYPANDNASFNGAWNTYPYFDSGVVIISGIEQGLFIVQPTTLPTIACLSPSEIPWLTVSPTSGTTAENSSTPVNVIFDSTGLLPGEYTASLCIESNAVTMPQVQVPITLTIPSNQVPVAGDDVYTTTQNMALAVAAPGVLSNDTDGDGQPLTAVLATGPSNGSLTLNADGSFIYTPTVGFVGSDSFTYRATDGINSSNIATVTITVTAQVGDIQLYLPFVANDD